MHLAFLEHTMVLFKINNNNKKNHLILAKFLFPFCNQLIQTVNDDDKFLEFKICEQTIFLAHNEGFEFRTNLVYCL